MYFEPNEKPNAPVAYMERTRLYYRALGYQKDYTWAHHDAVPFAQLKQAVTESTATIITTSNPPGGPPQGNSKLKEVWSDLIDTAPADLNTDNLAWDHEATHTRDRESYLPINALQNLALAGRIGGLSARFHGVPTTYSQRQTLVEDAPEVLRRCRADGSDIAFLVPL